MTDLSGEIRGVEGSSWPPELLVTLSESIQTHRRIIWLSYIVSARTIEIPLLAPEETRLLLTEPMAH